MLHPPTTPIYFSLESGEIWNGHRCGCRIELIPDDHGINRHVAVYHHRGDVLDSVSREDIAAAVLVLREYERRAISGDRPPNLDRIKRVRRAIDDR